MGGWHTTGVPIASPTPPQVAPPTEVLDDLELVRRGALPAAPGRLGGWVDLGPGPVEVVDPEGVSLALVSGDRVTWGAHRSGRPFEMLHRDVADFPDPRTTVVLTRPGRAAFLPGGPVRLLALASTDGEAPDLGVAVARHATVLAMEHPDAQVVLAPLGPRARRYPEKAALVAAAYSAGGRIVPDPEGTRSAPVPDPTGGTVLFLTGLSGSGKSTLARAVRDQLVETQGCIVTLLDGDVVRRHLSAGLGFGVADREMNVHRIGWVAAEIARHGGTVICSPIAPFARTRGQVREMVSQRGGRFVLVHVATPLQECERRDRKGLYARARRGELADFTGISSPYEEPADADLVLDTTGRDVASLRDQVLALLGH